MDLGKIRAVVFDFDGVVVNSEPFYENAISEVFQENHISIPQQDWCDFKGMADKEFFPLMISRYGFKGDIQKLEKDIYDRMKQKLVALDYIPGFKDFFDHIRKQYAFGLVTSTSRNHINWLTENTRIKDLFPLKVTATDVVHTKPHPEPYTRMARLLQLQPEKIIVIEDSINGLKAAQEAGMTTIALLTTFSRNEIQFADHIAGNYRQLMEMFGFH
ncbi:MAG: HAD family phosphatase [Candidatus Marinimicrobia bacterium]|nr:HAD family phosphatase [Candidatus Neomarinimicrobiota bacterium]